MKRYVGIVFGFLACALVSTQAWSAALEPLSAKDLSAKKTGAKATIVNLWATWCEPCKQEMPELIDYKKKNAARGVQLFLVDADSPDEQKAAGEFLTKLGVDFPAYFLADEPDAFMKPFAKDWPATIPTTMIFDSQGKRVGYWVGKIKMTELSAAVEKTLKTTIKAAAKTSAKTK